MKGGYREAHDELAQALVGVRKAKTNTRFAMNLHRLPESLRESLMGTLLKLNELESMLVKDFVKARARA